MAPTWHARPPARSGSIIFVWPGQLGFPVPLFFSAGTRPGASIYFSTMAVTLFFTASVHRGNAVSSRFSSKSYAWLGLAGRFHYFFRPGQLGCPVPLFFFGQASSAVRFHYLFSGRAGWAVRFHYFYLASRKINNGTAKNKNNGTGCPAETNP